MLKESFYERSVSDSAYRGERLGLVALHTLVLAVTKFYNLEVACGKVCCDNLAGLNQSSLWRKYIKTGAKQADLFRAIWTIKTNLKFSFVYEHVDSHRTDTNCGIS